jgi:hypothetical protein
MTADTIKLVGSKYDEDNRDSSTSASYNKDEVTGPLSGKGEKAKVTTKFTRTQEEWMTTSEQDVSTNTSVLICSCCRVQFVPSARAQQGG